MLQHDIGKLSATKHLSEREQQAKLNLQREMSRHMSPNIVSPYIQPVANRPQSSKSSMGYRDELVKKKKKKQLVFCILFATDTVLSLPIKERCKEQFVKGVYRFVKKKLLKIKVCDAIVCSKFSTFSFLTFRVLSAGRVGRGSYRITRNAPSQRITSSERERIINMTTKLLVATVSCPLIIR